MNKGQWKIKIRAACKSLGTYKPEFEMTIDNLAQIKELRQKALKQFNDEGCNVFYEHTNQGGSTNPAKHPGISALMEMYSKELEYQRDLGLTAKGFKSLGMDIEEEENSFSKMLADLGA